jgi:ABC-type multidrug transport system fused ATPase/permease subunit
VTERAVSRAGWRLLTAELAGRRRALVFLAGWSVVESLPALLSGVLVAAALDQGFIAHRPLIGFGWLGVLGLTLVIKAVATRSTFPWMADIVEPLRDVLVRNVVAGALGRAVNGIESGDGAAVARLSGHAETVRNLIAALLRTLRSTAVSVVLVLAGLFALTPVIALITAPFVLVSLALFAWSMRALTARHRAMILAEEEMARACTQIFDGLRDVVACSAVEEARQKVRLAVAAEARATIAVVRAASSRSLIITIGSHIPLISVLLLAPWLLRTGRLSAGELVGTIIYLVSTLSPALHSTTGIVGGWGRQLSVVLHRITETTADSAIPEDTGRAEPQSHDLHISQLSFAYGPCAAPVIDDLTLDIPAGEHLAIVGPSGIGKSTLASLIAGLIAPQQGTLLLGGIPIGEVGEARLRRTIGLIPQEAYVFTGTLRENLGYLRPSAETAELDTAVEALGMRALVDRLGGYGARLGIEGPELSAGERQLIALARVYVSAAQMIVLDEATCHLDPVAEARAEEALAATGRTLVVIAHRISSARRARRILLLDGVCAHAGTHEELLTASKLYADLVGHWERRPPPERVLRSRGLLSDNDD